MAPKRKARSPSLGPENPSVPVKGAASLWVTTILPCSIIFIYVKGLHHLRGMTASPPPESDRARTVLLSNCLRAPCGIHGLDQVQRTPSSCCAKHKLPWLRQYNQGCLSEPTPCRLQAMRALLWLLLAASVSSAARILSSHNGVVNLLNEAYVSGLAPSPPGLWCGVLGPWLEPHRPLCGQ